MKAIGKGSPVDAMYVEEIVLIMDKKSDSPKLIYFENASEMSSMSRKNQESFAKTFVNPDLNKVKIILLSHHILN